MNYKSKSAETSVLIDDIVIIRYDFTQPRNGPLRSLTTPEEQCLYGHSVLSAILAFLPIQDPVYGM
jgi:hypothetical protein